MVCQLDQAERTDKWLEPQKSSGPILHSTHGSVVRRLSAPVTNLPPATFVMLGTTAEDADAYQRRVSHLLAVPAAVRFVSYEPALGPLGPISISGRVPDWIIIGGESGVRTDLARGTHPQWARDAIAECRRENVAPFLKQWG